MSDLILTETVTDSVESVETVLVESSHVEIIESVVVDTMIDSVVSVESVETVTSEVVDTETIEVEIIEVAQQGPQGIQGIPGPAGGSTIQVVAGETLSGHRAIRLSHGLAYTCDAANLAHAGTGIGVSTGAALIGETVNVQTLGTLNEPSWTWNDGPIYVGNNGQLTQSITGLFMQQMGVATNATAMNINPQLTVIRSL